MSLLGSLLSGLSRVADSARTTVERNSDTYSSGYDRGASKASRMTDTELRTELKKAKDNGVSGWKSAGEVRAMADEYKSRNNK